MTGRMFRACVGGLVIVSDVCVFVLEALRGAVPSWLSLGYHAVFLILGLLLIDGRLGKQVLEDILKRVPSRRRRS